MVNATSPVNAPHSRHPQDPHPQQAIQTIAQHIPAYVGAAEDNLHLRMGLIKIRQMRDHQQPGKGDRHINAQLTADRPVRRERLQQIVGTGGNGLLRR